MNYQKLNLLLRCSKEYNHKRIRLEDLNDTECMILSFVYCNDNCSQENISNNLKIDKTTVGKAISALEKKELLIRKKSELDKRINHLSLTKKGNEKISKLLTLHDNWLKEILTVLNKSEQIQFEDYCNRLLIKAEELLNSK